MDNFIPDNSFEEDYTITGRELTTFVLQAGFVESIIPEKKTAGSISEAFQFIFRNNKEYGIILWNGIPIKFSYTEDLPLMIESLAALILGIGKKEQAVCFDTPSFSIEWNTKSDQDDNLMIMQNCIRISGDYNSILNQLGMISIKHERFLGEWKLLLNQLIEGFDRSEMNLLNTGDQKFMEQLRHLNSQITDIGSLYNYKTM